MEPKTGEKSRLQAAAARGFQTGYEAFGSDGSATEEAGGA
jgi:hypothetical protein